MSLGLDRRSLLAGVTAGGTALSIASAVRTQDSSGAFTQLIEAERAAIRTAMDEAEISSAAVCLLNEGEPVWIEGFGTGVTGAAVTGETLFSIQSTTKSMTAVAVLLAVQDGLLDLDAPISDYLPDFKVNSRFEDRPQDRMSLRLLLANRAGFTHEAPVGNNYEPASSGFEAHVRSISDTWLRFPVGERYRYSNLGYDLAGYVLEKVTGRSYSRWLEQRLFAPLGMNRSTADPLRYTPESDRASGQHRGYSATPLITPLIASGGVWTSARDMAAYAAFHLSRGGAVLRPELWRCMHAFEYGGDYGLGVMRTERLYGSTPVRILHHRGGGFGFGCNLVYCPEAGIGWAAMFNRPALAGYEFGAGLLDRLMTSRMGPRAARLPERALAPISPAAAFRHAIVGRYVGRNVRIEISEEAGQLRLASPAGGTPMKLLTTAPDELFVAKPDGEMVSYRYHAATEGLPAHLECSEAEASVDYNGGPGDPQGPGRAEWRRHVGRYRIDQWGQPAMEVAVEQRRGHLYLDGVRLIIETQPGLFFTSDGETVDFRGSQPTWRNLILRRLQGE